MNLSSNSEDHKLSTRHSCTCFSLIVGAGFLAACYLAFTVSAETPSAGKTKKAVQAAEAAAKKAKDAADAAILAGTATFGTSYPETDDGRAAAEADKNADAADAAAEDAEKAAAAAREKACRSGNTDDAKAADAAEQVAKDAEAKADAADAAADKADLKADSFGKQLQKKKRDAGRALRAAIRAARAAICFALQCAQLMDESSEQNQKKKKETIETIEGLDSSVDQLALAPQPGGGEVKTAQGLHRVTFDTMQGRAVVNLPDDMRAGDTISGTVLAEPKGQTPEERARNMSAMGDQKIKIATAKKPDGTSDVNVEVPVTATLSPFTFTLPPISTSTPPLTNVSSGSSGGLGITLTNTSGSFSTGGTTTVPIEMVSLSLQSVQPLTVFQLPTIGQQGRPIVITGPFDGHSSNTSLRTTVQDFEKNTENVSGGFGLIAESPRKAVFQAPTNVTGPIELNLKEGNVETKGTYRNVGVNLTAPKTSLLKGESTELRVEVNGLQGIKQPVPLTLESHGVITMVGGNYQPLVIQPSQVGPDGRFTTTRGITGIQTGGWTATATVVTHKFDICLQDDTAPARRILWNTFNGDYIFICPTCWPPKVQQGGVFGTTGESGGTKTGGTKTGGTTETGGTTPPADPNNPPGGLIGQGKMIMKGCIITLEHNAPDRRVFSRLDSCTTSGSSTIEDPKTKVKFTITDRNIADNTCQSQ